MSEPSRHVVQVVNSTEYGGVEEHIRALSDGLRALGDRVTVVVPPTPAADALASKLAADGTVVVRTGLTGLDSRRGPLGPLLQLRRVLLGLRPDVIHVHLTGYNGGRLAVLAATTAGVTAIVCTAHLAPRSRVATAIRLERMLLNRLVKRFIAVSAASLDLQLRFLGQPRAKSAVVTNGVDVDRFAPRSAADRTAARERLGLPLGVPVIGSVGRLKSQKSMRTLVAALPAILAARPDAHLMIAGDGPLRADIERQARDLGVADHLHLVGFQSDVPACLSAIDIFALPSLYEGLPISILEAMAMGLPVVTSAVDGVPEAVADGVTGYLVPPESPDRVATAVVALLSDPERARAMGEEGRAEVHRRFSKQRFVNAVRQQYDLALAGRAVGVEDAAQHALLP